jgi:glycine/serine hydroxymethyltransferase
MKQIGTWMNEVANRPEDEATLSRIAGEVRELCSEFPAPGL